MAAPRWLSMRTWPFWPNKTADLEARWLSTLHPPAYRWPVRYLLPFAVFGSLPWLYEFLYGIRHPQPTMEELERIAEGKLVENWWKTAVVEGPLKEWVDPAFIEKGVLSPPRSVDRVHEVSYLYEEDPPERSGFLSDLMSGLGTWRNERLFMTIVTDVERDPEPVPTPEPTEEEKDFEAYDEMVRLTLDPIWYSAAYHDPSSPRLFGEYLEQKVRMRKQLMLPQAHLWDPMADTPYYDKWQLHMAFKLLFPPSSLWVPPRRLTPKNPDEAVRITTTWEIRARDAEPQFVAATLCPRRVDTKEQDVCVSVTAPQKRCKSFVWWQRWVTRNMAGRECSASHIRLDYDGIRGVRDGKLLRGSRFPRIQVGVKSWENTPPVRDDHVHELTGPDAWFLRNEGKMQQLWILDTDMFDPKDAFQAEQLAMEEGQPFTGDYMDYEAYFADFDIGGDEGQGTDLAVGPGILVHEALDEEDEEWAKEDEEDDAEEDVFFGDEPDEEW